MRRWRRWVHAEHGSAVVAVALAAGIITTAVSLIAGVTLATRAVRVQHSVEKSALVAVDTIIGRVPGVPCDNARRVLSSAGLTPASCLIDGVQARVSATAEFGLVAWSGRAHAGIAPTHR